MKASLRSYVNSIESNSDLKIQGHYVIITNDSINDKYHCIEFIDQHSHMNFICDIGPVDYNQHITLLNFIDNSAMHNFISEVLESHGFDDGDDFIYGTTPSPEAFAKTGLLPEQPNWLLSRLAYSEIDGVSVPDSIIINHINLLSKDSKKIKLIRKSPQQKTNEFNRYYFDRSYNRALNDLLKNTEIEIPRTNSDAK